MKPDDFETMDDFIDAALRDESWRTVPLGFQRRVSDRLLVAGAIRSERLRFRFGLLAGVVAFTLLFGTTTMYVALGGVVSVLERSIPGFWGHVDNAVYRVGEGWPVGTAIAFASLALGACVFVYREALPYRNRLF